MDYSKDGIIAVLLAAEITERPSAMEEIYKIYAGSFRGADHLRRIQEEAQNITTQAFAATPLTRTV